MSSARLLVCPVHLYARCCRTPIRIELTIGNSNRTGVTALSVFSSKYPKYRVEEIRTASKQAIDWIKTAQRPDGSWYGSWGIVRLYFLIESTDAGVYECLPTSATRRAVLHVCDHVLGRIARARRRDVREQRPRPTRVRLHHREADERRRLGRELQGELVRDRMGLLRPCTPKQAPTRRIPAEYGAATDDVHSPCRAARRSNTSTTRRAKSSTPPGVSLGSSSFAPVPSSDSHTSSLSPQRFSLMTYSLQPSSRCWRPSTRIRNLSDADAD